MWRHTTEPGVCGVSSTSRTRHFGGSCYIRRQLACWCIRYRVSVYRVSGCIGQHTFRRRRSCSSQTAYHTFCRRSQATQRRHNLPPTPATPSASAQPSTDAHRPLSFGKTEGFSVRRLTDNAACRASMRVQPGNRGSQRNPTARANHPRARPTSHATVFVRDRPRAQPSSHRLVVLHTIFSSTVLRT